MGRLSCVCVCGLPGIGEDNGVEGWRGVVGGVEVRVSALETSHGC